MRVKASANPRVLVWARHMAGLEGATRRPGAVGAMEPKLKYDMICELDAVVAHLYGLDERHLAHIFETFHEGWGPGQAAGHATLGVYDTRLKTTLGHYRTWTKAAYPIACQRLKTLADQDQETGRVAGGGTGS